MLGKLLLLPVMGPINGLMWIGEQIQERTNTEFDAQENLHKQLLSLQLKFDMGELSEEEFDEQEEELLLRIQALEAELNVDTESEDEADFVVEPEFIVVAHESDIYDDQPRFKEEYEDNQNLVLSP